MKPLRIATYNVNGVNGRLPVLLRWLEQTAPDVVCLQEIKTPDEKFPSGRSTMPGTARSGMGRKATTAWLSSRAGGNLSNGNEV